MSSMDDIRGILAEISPLPGSSNLTSKEVDEIIKSTVKQVGDTNVDWDKRLNMLKTFRSLSADPLHHASITAQLRQLMPPLQAAVKDLRSQVSREACLTVAFLASQLGGKTDSFLEPMLPTLFTLLVANAKIVSTTGLSTLCLIYETVPSWRLLPPLQIHINSKSKEVRRAVCMLMKIVLDTWKVSTIQRQSSVVAEVMAKGLRDADPEARQTAREAFPTFAKMFPSSAKTTYDALDSHQQRQIQGSTSNNTVREPRQLGTSALPRTAAPLQPQPHSFATSSLNRHCSLSKKTSIPVPNTRGGTPGRTGSSGSSYAHGARSSSAIDIQAANRAAQRNLVTNGRTPLKQMGRAQSSLTSPVRESPQYIGDLTRSHIPLPNGGARTLDRSRKKTTKSSHSQPGSRSNSPPISRHMYGGYKSPYGQSEAYSPTVILGSRKFSSPPPSIERGIRRVSNSPISLSREMSPQDSIVVPNETFARSNYQKIPLSVISSNTSLAVVLEKLALIGPEQWNGLMAELHKVIIETKEDDVLRQCLKGLLKILFNALTATNTKATEKAICFLCLSELCSREGLRDSLAEYTELFIVRVTEVQTSETPREVVKAAEGCALAIAGNFPPETVARATCPIVIDKDFPINQLAIKMLQRLVETCRDYSKLRALLPEIVNSLVIAYDHPDSAVRKAAVFAIVALQLKVGSELEPFLSVLSGSKLKLLNLYVERAQNSRTVTST